MIGGNGRAFVVEFSSIRRVYLRMSFKLLETSGCVKIGFLTVTEVDFTIIYRTVGFIELT